MPRLPRDVYGCGEQDMIPKTLGGCVDRLYTLKDLESKAQQKVEEIHKERKEIEDHLIASLPTSGATGVMGKLAEARVKRELVPTVKDWNQLYAHILLHKDFALLERRASRAYCREIWENGDSIPGVEQFPVFKISLVKAK
jgi:hypothetical protein